MSGFPLTFSANYKKNSKHIKKYFKEFNIAEVKDRLKAAYRKLDVKYNLRPGDFGLKYPSGLYPQLVECEIPSIEEIKSEFQLIYCLQIIHMWVTNEFMQYNPRAYQKDPFLEQYEKPLFMSKKRKSHDGRRPDSDLIRLEDVRYRWSAARYKKQNINKFLRDIDSQFIDNPSEDLLLRPSSVHILQAFIEKFTDEQRLPNPEDAPPLQEVYQAMSKLIKDVTIAKLKQECAKDKQVLPVSEEHSLSTSDLACKNPSK